MKRLIVLALFVVLLPINGTLASSTYTVETLVEDWSKRYIDPTYWSSNWQGESANDKAAIPSEKYISQHDALCSAIKAIVQLGVETPESLATRYNVKLGFYFIDDFDKYTWDIDLYSMSDPLKLFYTIRIDANSGRFLTLYVNNPSNITACFEEQNNSIDALIGYWDNLYADSASYSPEVFASESKIVPLPEKCDITKRTALRLAIEMVLNLSNCDIDTLREYHPTIEFDATTAERRWKLFFIEESTDASEQESFLIIINSMTEALIQFTWRNIQF